MQIEFFFISVNFSLVIQSIFAYAFKMKHCSKVISESKFPANCSSFSKSLQNKVLFYPGGGFE